MIHIRCYVPICAIIFFLLYMCREQAVRAEEFDHIIRVDFSGARLSLAVCGETLREFPVALPKYNPALPIEGVVQEVVIGAWWHPTARTRRAYKEKKGIDLPEHISPGDPRNAMGAGKIIIVFTTPGANQTVRIHGTIDRASIGTRISRGCIRMFDEDFLELARLISGSKTKVIFE